jgi:hypothetical protein
VYVIPAELLTLLDKRIKDWISPEELDLERRLAQVCAPFRAVAIFQGRFVPSPLVYGQTDVRVNSDALRLIRAAGWDSAATGTSLGQAVDEFNSLTPPLRQRREAYLGWLMTCPTFRTERDALRSEWEDTVNRLGGIPVGPGRPTPATGSHDPAGPDSEGERMAEAFAAFYQRWHLLGLLTWDLPQAVMGNFGCPATVGKLCGVEDSPTVQLPPTLRPPDRFPLRSLLSSKCEAHLAEWQAVQDRKHPDKLNYVRLQRVFHLHVLRNVVLDHSYPDRFSRRTGQLDEVFVVYLGEDEQSVRKLRLWIDRRLTNNSPRRTRNR